MELQGKTAIVTGSGKGIGEGIALAMAKEGANIVVNARTREDIDQVVGKITALGGKAISAQADVTKKSQIEAMVQKTLDSFGMVDILVNNAGTEMPPALVQDLPESQWDRIMEVNLKSCFLCCQAVIPAMIKNGKGKIVNIASLAGRRMSYFGSAEYTASKYGMIGFSHHLAHELAMYRINVNVVSPGAVLTPLAEKYASKELMDHVTGLIPLARWLNTDDIAQAVIYLACEKSDMITGQSLDVDGGLLTGWGGNYLENMDRKIKRYATHKKHE